MMATIAAVESLGLRAFPPGETMAAAVELAKSDVEAGRAAMRDALLSLGGDPRKVNPLVPVDLVIDHSVMVDVSGSASALQKNVDIEFERNGERYEFLRWGQEAFDNFRVVPPGTGICHQVNLEYLGQVVWTATDAG